jgi:hypothetical protein
MAAIVVALPRFEIRSDRRDVEIGEPSDGVHQQEVESELFLSGEIPA